MQQGVDIEVLVVDDASDKETEVPAVVAEVADPRARAIRLSSRSGASVARNLGIELARGTWLAFLDDDDLWSPDKLRVQLARAEAADAGFVYGSAVYIDADDHVIHHAAAPDPADLASQLLSHNPVPGGGSNAIALASVVREQGGFDTKLLALQDWDCWIRLARSTRVAACPEIVVAYRIHALTMSATREIDKLEALSYLEEKYGSTQASEQAAFDRRRFRDWVGRYQRVLIQHQLARGDRRGAARTYVQLARFERSPQHLLRAGAAALGAPALRAGAGVKRAFRLSRPPDARALPHEPDWLARLRGAE
jgi:glycosyltransferase involved in cell wall biosynthesis